MQAHSYQNGIRASYTTLSCNFPQNFLRYQFSEKLIFEKERVQWRNHIIKCQFFTELTMHIGKPA